MAYDLAKVTANGNNLIAQILANKSSLSVDKIEISDTQLPSTTDISTMTSVPKVVQTVSANGFSKNSNTLIISTVVDNSSIRADYKAWVFGIWGSDSQNGQSQLIAVITSTNSPDTIPAFSGRTPVSYTYKFNIGFSNASQIKFNMINDSFATNDTVVHTTGDETINGQKKFVTDPTDSAGNAYAKTVDVNQQLDKKVNVADMRKPASDVAGIEEVNAKQDKIAYTPADDSKVAHLSGSNNFDTVPTVNTNPLLLASSLPSDLARTGSNQEFTGKNTFDTAPIDKTTGNPYITKDGAPNVDLSGYVIDNKNNTITANNVTYDLSKTGLTPIGFYRSGSFNDLPLGTVLADANSMTDGPRNSHAFTTTTFSSSQWGGRKAQIAISDNVNLMYFRVEGYNGGSISWNSWVLLSDDSAVVHNTGTEEIAGQKTFTAAQTFSIAPTITDASKDKGDTQAATMADLKSVENSAWIQLDATNGTDEIALCRVDGNKLWVVWAFKREGDQNYKEYSIGEVPQLIQGKNFSGFNTIFGGSLNDFNWGAYIVNGRISISSNSIRVNYNGYPNTGGYSMYGYFTFM